MREHELNVVPASKVILWFGIFALQFLFACTESSVEANFKCCLKDKKNLVFILADDLGYGDVSSYNSSADMTPFIDSIAEQGQKMINFYSSSSTCTPSRAAIFTGNYPIRSNLTKAILQNDMTGIDPSHILIPEALKFANYKTGLVGKWHLGNLPMHNPLNHGFDTFYGSLYSNDIPGFSIYRNQRVEIIEPDQSELIHQTTNEAISFIEDNKNDPFAIFVNYNAPHVPLHPGKEFVGLSGKGDYHDIILELDRSIGSIWEYLASNDLLESTILIITSDNGANASIGTEGGSNRPLRGGKNTVFEGGFKVPFIMLNSELNIGEYDVPMVSIDLFPTILEMLGFEHSWRGDGISRYADLKNEIEDNSDFVMYFFRQKSIEAVRKGKYKLIEQKVFDYYLDEPNMLFNIVEDPFESNNLYHDPRYEGVKRDLQNMIDTFR